MDIGQMSKASKMELELKLWKLDGDQRKKLASVITNIVIIESSRHYEKKEYCFDFQRTGACSRKNCKFTHINSRSSYPYYSQRAVDTQRTEQSKSKQRDLKSSDIGNRKFSGNRSRNGPRTLRKSFGSYSNNICFNYQNHCRCHFGKRCRFLHIENDHFNFKPRHGENRYANFNKQNNFNSR